LPCLPATAYKGRASRSDPSRRGPLTANDCYVIKVTQKQQREADEIIKKMDADLAAEKAMAPRGRAVVALYAAVGDHLSCGTPAAEIRELCESVTVEIKEGLARNA
jgi:hypothetical protein